MHPHHGMRVTRVRLSRYQGRGRGSGAL